MMVTHGAGVEDRGPVGGHPEGDDEQEVHQVSQEEGDHHEQQEASHHTLQALHRGREGGRACESQQKPLGPTP